MHHRYFLSAVSMVPELHHDHSASCNVDDSSTPRWYQPQFSRRCHWNRGQICHRCHWYRWCTLTCEYLREFSKKFETVLMGHSGAGGKLTHERNQKQKILWHCPFKTCVNCHSTQRVLKLLAKKQYCRGVLYSASSVLYITVTENCLSILLKIPVPKFKDLILTKTSPKLGL
jgi:hypothetical protein